MSKFNLIALAIAASLAAPAAYAVDVTTTPDVFPTNSITATATVTNTAAIEIAADATDNYLGRSTGYNVKVTLTGGATFAAPVVVATGLSGETVTIAGGGTVGADSVTFSVVPATGVVEGDGISIPANAFVLEDIQALANGGTVGIDVRIGDPVGGNELASKNGTSIASAKQGWVVTYVAPTNANARIDVSADSGKKEFSSSGIVGDSLTGLYNAGSVTIALDPDLTNPMGLALATATAPLILSGVDFSAFKQVGTPPAGPGKIVLTDDATCAAGTQIVATVAANGLTASIPAGTTAAALNTSKHICFQANGETVIAAQDLNAGLIVRQTGRTASPNFTDSAGKLLDMKYNGTVVAVDHFNPSSNVNQISYLRVINPGNIPGLVSVAGVCDNGTVQAPVSLTLAAGNAVLLTANDLATGAKGLSGAFTQCGAGKSRLTVTGEFAGMKVQNFLRNVTADGTQINTNVNNEH